MDVDAELRLRVVTVTDLALLKLFAAGEPSRRHSKRLVDYADVVRLLEEHPELATDLPDIRERMSAVGTKILTATVDVHVGTTDE